MLPPSCAQNGDQITHQDSNPRPLGVPEDIPTKRTTLVKAGIEKNTGAREVKKTFKNIIMKDHHDEENFRIEKMPRNVISCRELM